MFMHILYQKSHVHNSNVNNSQKFLNFFLSESFWQKKKMVDIFTPGKFIALFISLPFEILSVILSTIQLLYVNYKIGKTNIKTSNWSPLPSVGLLIKNVRRAHLMLLFINFTCLSFFFTLNFFELSKQCYVILNFGLPAILICTIYSIFIAIQAGAKMGPQSEYMIEEDEESNLEVDKNNPYKNVKACQICIIVFNSIMLIPFILIIGYLFVDYFGITKR